MDINVRDLSDWYDKDDRPLSTIWKNFPNSQPGRVCEATEGAGARTVGSLGQNREMSEADGAKSTQSGVQAPQEAGGQEGAGVEVSPSGDRLSDDERAERMGNLLSLMELMRPAVQADGGDLVLVSADVESGTVEVQLQGACSSCAISSATLQGGVERILRDRLAWVTEVVGGVDDSIDPFESAAQGKGAYIPGY